MTDDDARDQATGVSDLNREGSDDAADRRAQRREEMRRKWIEKRKAEEAAAEEQRLNAHPAEKLLDLALTPTYIAVGGAIIVYRKVRGLPPIQVDDYE